MNWKEKNNDEIFIDLKQMELDYTAVKSMILKYFDILENIEKKYKEGNEALNKRLNGGD